LIIHRIFLSVYSILLHQSIGVKRLAFSTGSFWFTLLLIGVIILLPMIAREYVNHREQSKNRRIPSYIRSRNAVEQAPRP
jgi:hypothetical protein